MYQQTDRFLKKLKDRIRREYNHLSVLAFDELNILRCKKETEAMFKRLLEFNEQEYKRIVSAAILYAVEKLSKEQKKKAKTDPVDEYIEYVLVSYNPVTQYLYYPEADRKRLRLVEMMMTAKEFLDRETYQKAINKGANLWYTQSGQYAQDIEDHTVTEVWRRSGVKHVQWITQMDDRTCEDCKELNHQIFPIDRIPPKQHYNCRCYWVPYD